MITNSSSKSSNTNKQSEAIQYSLVLESVKAKDYTSGYDTNTDNKRKDDAIFIWIT